MDTTFPPPGYTEREIKFIDLPLEEEESAEASSEVTFVENPEVEPEAGIIRYAYIEDGELTSPLVILLHGFPDNALAYDATITKLAETGCRMIAPFLRGYYPTALSPKGDYSIHSIAKDIFTIAEALEYDKFCLVGHDWGAYIAYLMANMEPTKVEKLVSLSLPHPKAIPPTVLKIFRAQHFIASYPQKFAIKYTQNNGFAYLDYLYKYWSPNWKQPAEHLKMIKAAFSEPGYLEAALAYYPAFFEDTQDEEKHRILEATVTVPSLVFAGDANEALEVKVFEAMTPYFTDVKLVTLPGVGHFPHHEAGDTINPMIGDFLKPVELPETAA